MPFILGPLSSAGCSALCVEGQALLPVGSQPVPGGPVGSVDEAPSLSHLMLWAEAPGTPHAFSRDEWQPLP